MTDYLRDMLLHIREMAEQQARATALLGSTPRPIRPALELSDCAETLARTLAKAHAIQLGVADKEWGDWHAGAQERFRELAERAMAWIDPARRLEAISETAAEMEHWNPTGWTTASLVRETCGRYEANCIRLTTGRM